MTMNRRHFLILAGMLSCAVLPYRLAGAAIVIQPDFQGTLILTSPEGEVNVIEPGDPIPQVPSNSTIEAINGQFTIRTDEGETVKASCHRSQATAANGGAFSMNCGAEAGVLKALEGSVALLDSSGKQTVLEAGSEYPIPGGEPSEEAPATAATVPTGGLPVGAGLGEGAPVDSRSIESSPAT